MPTVFSVTVTFEPQYLHRVFFSIIVISDEISINQLPLLLISSTLCSRECLGFRDFLFSCINSLFSFFDSPGKFISISFSTISILVGGGGFSNSGRVISSKSSLLHFFRQSFVSLHIQSRIIFAFPLFSRYRNINISIYQYY